MTTEEEARAILWRVQQRAWSIAERLRLARLAGDPIRAEAVRAAWRPIQEMIHDRHQEARTEDERRAGRGA